MEGIVSSKQQQPLVFAYYVTGHGFGHATRVVEVVRHLILEGHIVHVVTAAPDFVYTSAIQSPRLFLRKELLDCGAVQCDALTVDRIASLEKYSETAVIPRETILATEVKWLQSIKADLVVSDVVPVACRAAADAGIRSVCCTNFSWDFIYAEYVVDAGSQHRSIVLQIAEDYSHCEFLIRLPGYCPMPAFRDVLDVPLVVRGLHKSRAEVSVQKASNVSVEQVRKELGVEEDVKLVIFNFGGQPAGWKLQEEFLPPGWKCVVCGGSDKEEYPPNFIKLPKDAYTPDVIAASDCMLGKIGYGTFSEAMAYKLPFVFVRRDYFNEELFLRNMLEHYHGGVEMIRRDLLTGCWQPYLERAIRLKPCYDGGVNGGEVAARILQDTALGKNHASDKPCGARRLRDAIVLGYQLQRVNNRIIGIPDWYNLEENKLVGRSSEGSQFLSREVEDFEILHGDPQGLPDTMAFLKSLADIGAGHDSKKDTDDEVREDLAAAGLFNWEEEIFVARAPGRLDVLGGIADYSGSLVLQMPIREACHVAVQKNHPSKQKLWKHAQARHHADHEKLAPILEIVSLGSELNNRGPTFDMDLSDFKDGEKPISYEAARKYFAKDPSQKWAAYAAGTIVVLMTELGVCFENSISILVSSGVPEGKGVSSSAALEVATMSAIAAAHGLNIPPRDLALLCQKASGESCCWSPVWGDGSNDLCVWGSKQTSSNGMPGVVDIPSHVRFWGIDSGLRHSVGGSDYGSVRIGTYMGRKIIKSTAAGLSKANNKDDMDKDGIELLNNEASLDYLCNLPPHRYEGVYVDKLPETVTGEEFIKKYHDHEDSVTTIDPKHIYAVKAPTRHPVYENFRVEAFKALLSATTSDGQLSALGELMYQCHYSYGACGLGSDGTDRLVELVQEMQHRKASKSENGTLYGAKITGGGSGGTVCVIGKNFVGSNEQILEIQRRYHAATGFKPYVFEGSSPGAGKFGYLKIRRRNATE
ncbi:L-arabinokinase-like [Populus alba x Populus x berolinensis]|nr:L-arabinokinase-like [Populus alba x Populus x berolinensis]